MMNSAPIKANSWLVSGAAACQRLIEGGTMLGQMLIASPR